jgi:integrase
MRDHLLPTDKKGEHVAEWLMREPGKHCDGGGLYLEVAAPGQASWMYRHKNRWGSLGSANGYSIRQAREKAAKLWQAARRGEDPFVLLATLRAPKVPEKPKGKTFAEAMAKYIAAKSPSWSPSNRARETRRHEYLFGQIPDFVALRLPDIDQDAKNTALATWNGQPKARRDVGFYIEAIIRYAETGKLRIRGGGVPEAQHLEAMPWRDVPAFYDRISKLNSGGDAVRALRFTILTGARTDEVIGRFERGVWAKARPTWREIVDVDGQPMWIIPGGLTDEDENFRGMKGKKDHSVPLSPAALALLGERRADDAPLFDVPTNGMLNALKANGGNGYTVHGFRSSFSDWATAGAGYNADIVDACIAHPDENLTPSKRKVRKSYQRDELLEKRREIMQAWGDYVSETALVEG